jgi:hypothetical protein
MMARICGTTTMLAILFFGSAAIAESTAGYDPGRGCHFYVVQHLPVPVHCMAELIGNWVPRPYIDGAFMFRSREEWLSWRDREDYRHWKNHDYSWQGAGATPPVAAPPALPPSPVPSGQAAAVLSCPLTLAVRVVPSQRLTGWTGSDADATLPLQPPPRAEGGTLYCSYAVGRERLTLTRPAWGHCVTRADATGFDCTP